MNSTHVEFPCGDITLEGEWHLPQEEGPFPVVVVCHPHSLYGGNMRNNVVIAICETLSQQSVAALRFNFRGVGKSSGKFGGGITEQEDVKAALDFASSSSDVDPKRIGLAGYSFGGSVALPAVLQDERISCLALVSPALSDSGWEQLKEYSQPKFVIVGDADSIVQRERLQQYIKEVRSPAQYQMVPGADHFWLGYEQELALKVAQFFVTGLEGC